MLLSPNKLPGVTSDHTSHRDKVGGWMLCDCRCKSGAKARPDVTLFVSSSFWVNRRGRKAKKTNSRTQRISTYPVLMCLSETKDLSLQSKIHWSHRFAWIFRVKFTRSSNFWPSLFMSHNSRWSVQVQAEAGNERRE